MYVWRLFLHYYFFLIAKSSVGNQIETVIVETPSGPIKGLKDVFTETGDTVYEFRGIRYAQPPTGPLRFKKPEPVGKWTETYDATSFGAACPQTSLLYENENLQMSEDCLVLNVYVPKVLDPGQSLSVMVWIHGGELIMGHAHEYNGGRIAVKGTVIVVTINYRLGVFGFFALDHPAAKGNYAIWDQIQALKWVQQNIAAFGGNPNSVTIFGESAGGWSVNVQMMIPSNKGLFHRAISQSGVFDFGRTSMLTANKLRGYAEDLANKTECPMHDMYQFVDCLRQKPFDELVQVTDLWASLPNDKVELESRHTPVIDGELFMTNPYVNLEDGNSDVAKFFHSIDFVAGTTSNEGSLLYMLSPGFQDYFGFNVTEGIPSKAICEGIIGPYIQGYLQNDSEIKSKLCKFYTTDKSSAEQSLKATKYYGDMLLFFPTVRMLEYHSSMGGKTYQYVFSKLSPLPLGGPPPPWFKGCGHGDELTFQFSGKMFSTEDIILNDEQRELSDLFIQYWTSFAKTGLPDGGEGSVLWKQFTIKDRNYLNFDTPVTIGTSLEDATVKLWTGIFENVVYQSPEDTDNHDEL